VPYTQLELKLDMPIKMQPLTKGEEHYQADNFIIILQMLKSLSSEVQSTGE